MLRKKSTFLPMFFIMWAGILMAGIALDVWASKHQVDAANFDGAKFAQKYGLEQEDFYAVYEDGQMFVIIRDGITLPDDPPIFEAPDTTKRDRLAALRVLAGTRNLTLPELNEYIRLRDGI